MVRLLNLPVELLEKILESLVYTNDLDDVMAVRQTCRLLDDLGIRAVCTARILEDPKSGKSGVRYTAPRLISEYLAYRTLSDRSHEHHLSQVIRDTVNYILKLQEKQDDEQTYREYTRALCMATALHHCFHSKNVYGVFRFLNPEHPQVLYRAGGKTSSSMCTIEENVMVALVYLGIIPLFHKLVEEQRSYMLEAWPSEEHSQGQDQYAEYHHHHNPGKMTYFGQALVIAAAKGHISAMETLLQPQPWARCSGLSEHTYMWTFGQRCVREAARAGRMDSLDYLFSSMAAVTPLPQRWAETIYSEEKAGGWNERRASRCENFDEIMLGYICSLYGTVLRAGASSGHINVVQLALSKGAGPNQVPDHRLCFNGCNCENRMALELAAAHGHEQMVRFLLSVGAAPNIFTCTRYVKAQPLISAVRGGWLDIAKILIDHGAYIDPPSKSERLRVMKEMIARLGSDRSSIGTNLSDQTFRLEQRLKSRRERHKADKTTVNMERAELRARYRGRTTLATAILRSQTKMAEFLLEQGATVNRWVKASVFQQRAWDMPPYSGGQLLIERAAVYKSPMTSVLDAAEQAQKARNLSLQVKEEQQ